MPVARKAADEFLGKATKNPIVALNDAHGDTGLLEKLALLKIKDFCVYEEFRRKLRYQAGVKKCDVDALNRVVTSVVKKSKLEKRAALASKKTESPRFAKLRAELSKLLPCDWYLPAGYDFVDGDEVGLFRVFVSEDDGDEKEHYTHIAWAPIVIVGRSKDISTSIEFVTLAWRKGARWQTRVVSRLHIADSRKLIELAAFGVPVSSTNAPALVEYLAAFEARNIEVLPCSWTASQLGWLSVGGKKLFLLGKKTLSDDESIKVTFRAEDVGDEQVASAFAVQEGTLGGWKNAVSVISQYWRIQVACFQAVAIPM